MILNYNLLNKSQNNTFYNNVNQNIVELWLIVIK